MSHQDWKSVTITGLQSKKTLAEQIRTGEVKRDIVAKENGGKNSHVAKPVVPDVDEIVVPPVTTRAVGDQIRDARNSETNKQNKKLTQRELDRLCNFSPGTVQTYENNTAIYSQQNIDRISKVLGVTIKKNPNKK